jgi:integrase
MMLVFNDTGSRPGEVRALRWRDIDFSRRFIPVKKAIETGTKDREKETKTGASKAAFLTKRTAQELAVWLAGTAHGGDDDYVFTLDGAVPVTNSETLAAFRRGVRAAGLRRPELTTYWLRHSFGTYMMEVLDDKEIARLMGNSPAILKKVYQHPSDELIYKSALGIQERMDRARGD